MLVTVWIKWEHLRSLIIEQNQFTYWYEMIIKIPAERPGKKITNASYCNSASHVCICRLYCINTFYSVYISTVILLIKVIGFAVYLVKWLCCDVLDTDTDDNLGLLSQSHNFWVLFAYWSAGYLQTCKYVSIKVSGSLVTACLNICVCMTCLLLSSKQGGCELGNLRLPCPGLDLSFDLKEKSLCCCMSEAAGELCQTLSDYLQGQGTSIRHCGSGFF